MSSPCCSSDANPDPAAAGVSQNAAAQPCCPLCGGVSRKVGLRTLKHQLRPNEARELDGGAAYGFCPTVDCPAVYFVIGGDAPRVWPTSALRQPVTQKCNGSPDQPLCYCFGHTARDARLEIDQTGGCQIQARIAAEMKAGLCACEVRNPQGSCCLANVRTAIRAMLPE